MRIPERSAQLWSVLALAARSRQVLTYDLTGRLIGVPRAALGQLLEPIQSYCLIQELPPLTALVVSAETGLPGAGFIAAADVPRVQQRVFAYDWVQHGCPSPDAFGEAVRSRPSNGIPDDGAEAPEP
jgi:hypothetical protein